MLKVGPGSSSVRGLGFVGVSVGEGVSVIVGVAVEVDVGVTVEVGV
jgi:hypothetical protein